MRIRTQDRRNLVDMNGLTIRVCTEDAVYKGHYAIIAVSNANKSQMEFLGGYTSNEKALKVLDMIEQEYLSPITKNVISDNEIEIYQNKIFVMPEDEEV